MQMSEDGRQPITAVDFVPKGRSFNLIVGDALGRFSMHNRNGTGTASARIETGGPITAFYGWGTVCALSPPPPASVPRQDGFGCS